MQPRTRRTPAFRVEHRRGEPHLIWDNPPRRARPEEVAKALRDAVGSSRQALDLVVRKLPDPKEYLAKRLDSQFWMRPVLMYGKEYRAKDPGPHWTALKSWQCYENAMTLAKRSNGRLAYAEGICVSPFGTLLHAWNMRGSQVIDRTWPMAHMNRYYGIVFGLDFLLKTSAYRRGCVFGYWEPLKQYLDLRARR